MARKVNPNWDKVYLNETPKAVGTKIVKETGKYLILYQGQIVNNSKLVIEMNTQLWIDGVKTKAMVTNIMPKMHYGIPTVFHIASLKKGSSVEIRHHVDVSLVDIPLDTVWIIMDSVKHTFAIAKLEGI